VKPRPVVITENLAIIAGKIQNYILFVKKDSIHHIVWKEGPNNLPNFFHKKAEKCAFQEKRNVHGDGLRDPCNTGKNFSPLNSSRIIRSSHPPFNGPDTQAPCPSTHYPRTLADGQRRVRGTGSCEMSVFFIRFFNGILHRDVSGQTEINWSQTRKLV